MGGGVHGNSSYGLLFVFYVDQRKQLKKVDD